MRILGFDEKVDVCGKHTVELFAMIPCSDECGKNLQEDFEVAVNISVDRCDLTFTGRRDGFLV